MGKRKRMKTLCLILIVILCSGNYQPHVIDASSVSSNTTETELTEKEKKAIKAKEKAEKRYKELNKNKFVVRFDANGGTKANFDVGLLKTGESLKKSIYEPKRSGYTFLGWYTEKNKLVKYDTTLESDKDIVLKAKWQKIDPEKFKVTFIMPDNKEKKVHVVPGKEIGKLPKAADGSKIVWCKKSITGVTEYSIDSETIVNENDTCFYVMRVEPLPDKSGKVTNTRKKN